MPAMKTPILAAAAALAFSVAAIAAYGKPDLKPDLDAARDIMGVCAACHGDNGQGGKRGEYPRLAGQHMEYLAAQLAQFKTRRRVNIPMFPYTEERELAEQDIVSISAYLANIKLDTTPPAFKEGDDALTRLNAMAKVLQIPRAEGDVDAGGKLYNEECAPCHSKTGLGWKTTPMLAGQYTSYLKRQIDKFRSGERKHDEDQDADPADDILNQLKPEQIRDVLAYISTLGH